MVNMVMNSVMISLLHLARWFVFMYELNMICVLVADLVADLIADIEAWLCVFSITV